MAAGVTPEMRDAMPSVSGRCLLSFCRTSMRQRRHLQVVQLGRQPQVLVVGGALHLVLLALDVAGVLGADLHLLDHRRVQLGQCFT
jgi:hypothetical protein